MGTRTPAVIANWKMNMTLRGAEQFAHRLAEENLGDNGVEMIVCAPFTILFPLIALVEPVPLIPGAQNMHWEKDGAFTGEVSAPMLQEIGVRYVIIGHSERRIYFGETDDTVARKAAAAYAFDLVPILCLGENKEERHNGETEAVIRRQLLAGSALIEQEEDQRRLVVAYEPVWAIGTGIAAGAEDAAAVTAYIRSLLEDKWGDVSKEVRILYGGSVNPDNIGRFTRQPGIDGALVGNSSLNPLSFAAMVRAVERGK